MVSAFDTLGKGHPRYFAFLCPYPVPKQWQILYYHRGLGPNVAKTEQLPYESYAYLSQTRNTNQENLPDKHTHTDKDTPRHTRAHMHIHKQCTHIHTNAHIHTQKHTHTHTIAYAHMQCTFKHARDGIIQVLEK